ncbi:MAG: hypothetical protein ACK4IT_06375 [Thioalkalivibrionaceae bacterium]
MPSKPPQEPTTSRAGARANDAQSTSATARDLVPPESRHCTEDLRHLIRHPAIRACGWADRLFFRDADCRQPRVNPCEAVVFLATIARSYSTDTEANAAPNEALSAALTHAAAHLDESRRVFLIGNARRHEMPLFRTLPAASK